MRNPPIPITAWGRGKNLRRKIGSKMEKKLYPA